MKLIVIDMDGTLLNDDLMINHCDVDAIKQAQSRGDLVAIATGRAYFDAAHILRKHQLQCPIVSSNGAELGDGKDYEIIEEIPQRLVGFLIEYLNSNKYYYQVYHEDRIAASTTGERYMVSDLEHSSVPAEDFWKEIKPQIEQYGLTTTNALIDPDLTERMIKLIVVCPLEDKMQQLKCLLQSITPLNTTSSNKFNLEIGSSKVNKERTIQRLVQKYKVDLDNCYVIGDSYNDLPLFRYFKHRIAMQNAVPQIKDLASYLTLNNNSGGVSHAIFNYIL